LDVIHHPIHPCGVLPARELGGLYDHATNLAMEP
jgi:hypothetical protein